MREREPAGGGLPRIRRAGTGEERPLTFQELNLSQPLLRAVAEAGYDTPSPIQAGAIPPVLAGRDLLGCAQTGTGKTAAFALPMLDRLSASRPGKPGAVRALVLTPTRELALQIGESFALYGKYLPLRHTVVFGGVGQGPQVEALKKGVEILIACPGRLNDLIGQGLAELSGVEIFVLDEADRMLDMGFVHDVKKVIAKLPAKRQNLMFSATMPAEIEQLAAGILKNPAQVKVDPVSSTVDRIQQSLYFVEKGNKRFLLPWLIQNLTPPVENALVFSRTKHGADKIARDLAKQGIPAAAIHGNKSQSARVAALEGFKAGKTKVLVATDIAARGIDISELAYVFNYDLPEVPETYVHRIGRTARAGAEGAAVSFCAPEEKEYLAGIEKLNRKKIPVVPGHPWDGAPAPAKAGPLAALVRPRRPEASEGTGPKPAPTPKQENEETRMEDTEKRGSRRSRRGNRTDADRSRPAAQNAPRPQRTEKGGGSAQPKFDPHFLSGPETSALPMRTVPMAQNPKTASRDRIVEAGQTQAPARDQGSRDPGQNRSQNQNQNGGRRGGQNAKPAPRAEKAGANAARAERTEKPSRAEKNGANAPRPERNQGRSRPAKNRSAVRDDDPGLVLISRRPPRQKFASFEEYMAAHGGATAPIEDHTEE